MLLVTCTNDVGGGGLYVVDGPRKWPNRVYPYQCMGITRFRGYYVLASQSVEGLSEELIGGFPCRPHSIVCLDHDFNIVSEAWVQQLGMSDLHDIMIYRDRLYVVDTFGNRVVVFDVRDEGGEGALPFARWYIKPCCVWKDPRALEPDAVHLNSICVHNGKVLVSALGRFQGFRDYEGRGDDGCILDITRCFGPFDTREGNESEPNLVCSGLRDPHSLVSYQGELYFAEARRRRVHKGGGILASFQRGYVRGVLLEEEFVWIGVSASRHSPDTMEHAEAERLSRRSGEVTLRVEFPAREIYGFL